MLGLEGAAFQDEDGGSVVQKRSERRHEEPDSEMLGKEARGAGYD